MVCPAVPTLEFALHPDPRVRVFGYAGAPFISSLPSLYLSIAAVAKVYKINKHLQRSRGQEVDFENLQPLPRSIQIREPGLAPPPPRTFTPTVSVPQDSSRISSLIFQAPHNNGKVSPQSKPAAGVSNSTISTAGPDDDDNTTSPTFPAFSNPITRSGPRDPQLSASKDDWRQILTSAQSVQGDDDDKPASLGWLGDEDVYKINTGPEFGRDPGADDLDGVPQGGWQRRACSS